MSTPVPHPVYAQVGAVGGAVVVVVGSCARHVPARRVDTAAMYLNSILMRVGRAGTCGRGRKDSIDWSLDCHARRIPPTGRSICFHIAGCLFKYLGITTPVLKARTLPSRIHDMSTFRIKE